MKYVATAPRTGATVSWAGRSCRVELVTPTHIYLCAAPMGSGCVPITHDHYKVSLWWYHLIQRFRAKAEARRAESGRTPATG
jgi:hypothetical protein